MPTSTLRRTLRTGLAWPAAVACVACCVLPTLLVAGVIGGTGVIALTGVMPTVALILAGLAVSAWGPAWSLRRRRRITECAGTGCGCQDHRVQSRS